METLLLEITILPRDIINIICQYSQYNKSTFSAGSYDYVAIKDDGSIIVWGSNRNNFLFIQIPLS